MSCRRAWLAYSAVLAAGSAHAQTQYPQPYQPPPYEIPPPEYGYGAVHEPPPPPEPQHVAPKTAFWLGARGGWLVPFGNLWGARDVSSTEELFVPVAWGEAASSGPMFEVDVGARLGRDYNIFLLWEHTELGEGDGGLHTASQVDAVTDFWGLGVRISSEPDDLGLLVEIAIGFRTFSATWDDDLELSAYHAPLSTRIGLGADIRINPYLSLSPLVTLGFGSFSRVDWVTSDSTEPALTHRDVAAGHGALALQIGGHFDLGE